MGISPAYLSRIERGKGAPPSRGHQGTGEGSRCRPGCSIPIVFIH
ncbi:MAG: helix-turn-helix transcriptional regulator [Acidobacteriota bacterium]|nr:helix-turn-helix transcriptional regulator [Acidobacteriota bacterium]